MYVSFFRSLTEIYFPLGCILWLLMGLLIFCSLGYWAGLKMGVCRGEVLNGPEKPFNFFLVPADCCLTVSFVVRKEISPWFSLTRRVVFSTLLCGQNPFPGCEYIALAVGGAQEIGLTPAFFLWHNVGVPFGFFGTEFYCGLIRCALWLCGMRVELEGICLRTVQGKQLFQGVQHSQGTVLDNLGISSSIVFGKERSSGRWPRRQPLLGCGPSNETMWKPAKLGCCQRLESSNTSNRHLKNQIKQCL